MHSYLRSIGYSNILQQSDAEDLICDVISHAERRESYVKEDGTTLVEYSMGISQSCGVRVRGEEDAYGSFHFSHYFPYCMSNALCKEDEIYINKRVDTDAYTGMCDDYRIGISMIFYIQNLVDYFHLFEGLKCIEAHGVNFAALSQEGTIILPTQIRVEDENRQKAEIKKKNQLLAEAKKGNPDAMERLSLQDIDRYAIISQRIKQEDILSIVDTSFVPYGSESDIYNIIATILEVTSETNRVTGDKIWKLFVDCNEVQFYVCINEKDLVGEPKAGRRFKGQIWMQGELERIF